MSESFREELSSEDLNEEALEMSRWRAVIAFGIAIGMSGFLAASSYAGNPKGSGKLIRQLGIMEKIVDQALLDSPNFLVPGRDNTRGLYLESFGAIFTFEAALVDRSGNYGSLLPGNESKIEVETLSDGTVVIRRKDKDKDKHKDEDEDAAAEEDEDALDAEAEAEAEAEALEVWAESHEGDLAGRSVREAKQYERGKQELIHVLLDYGDTMTTLKEGQSIAIAAFLKDSEYFREQKISRLLLRAQIEDLRAYTAGTLSETEMRDRILEEEY